MYKRLSLIVVMSVLMLSNYNSISQEKQVSFPSIREQVKVQQEWLKIRLERVLPELMRENKVQMWIIIMREYNEDPVFSSLVSPTTFFARRRTILVFFDMGNAKGIERIALGGGTQGGEYAIYKDTTLQGEYKDKEQWITLKKLILERNPENIAVNISRTFAFSDGLSASEYEQLKEYLGSDITKKLIHSERLPLDLINIRLPEMIPYYKKLLQITHEIVFEAFSNKVIIPGKTTTEDVVWWMREKAQKLGFQVWFQPSVDIQRYDPNKTNSSNLIIHGDLLHCDFGIKGMNLCTDVQYMAYVLKDDEVDIPKGLKQILNTSNRLQDILIANMKIGLTGNQVLFNSLEQMKKEKINGSIYSHPIGEYGHSAGAPIGLYDKQEGVPGRGDVPLLPNTWYSIELQATIKVPEWNYQPVRSAQEENAMIDVEGKVEWVLTRQLEFLIIK